jgi:hypothetical protein
MSAAPSVQNAAERSHVTSNMTAWKSVDIDELDTG